MISMLTMSSSAFVTSNWLAGSSSTRITRCRGLADGGDMGGADPFDPYEYLDDPQP